jgi:hypothetical protein
MTYVFDIDGTICTKAADYDYESSEPIQERIDYINRLFDSGHVIIFQTARGMGRSRNSAAYANAAFYIMTQEQLKSWGVRYHDLFLGKPAGDIYIDDKGVRDTDFFDNLGAEAK